MRCRRRQGADIGAEDELARHLAAHGVADLPLTGPDLIALAADRDWEPGPAQAALARPAWWAAHDTDWGPIWHDLAAAAAGHSPAALILLTRAAITGATLDTPPSRHTQRFQQGASTAIAACYSSGQPLPAGFLAALADGAPAHIAPKPEHVRTAVAAELRTLGVPDPDATAITLLPEASLT